MACYYEKKSKKLDKYVPSLFPVVIGLIAAYFMFEQPDLDIYVKSYDNFFNKLASRFHRDWPFIDFDEFKQLCYLALVKLYKGNYMINKNLLQKSCTNEILLFLRKYKHESETVSIYGKVKNEKNADLSLASILIDEREMRRLEEEEEREYNKIIYARPS